MRHAVWRAPALDVHAVAELCVAAGVSPLVGRLLHNRGVTAATVELFLRPSVADTHDPFLLPDMDKAVERLSRAIDAGEKVTVYGDYDVDGTTATALLLGVLRRAGAEADFYIPDRASEGYGMNADAMRSIREGGASIVLTVDCGITAREPIAAARALGLDVIVTDHHAIDPDRLPSPGDAVALINPRVEGCEYPFPDLAGVGLAYKLGQALLATRGSDGGLEDELDLVALGTIADIANLRDENRAMAKAGLAVMSRRERPGIRALCEVAGVPKDVDLVSSHVGFTLGPRINAAGRLDTAHVVVELLTTDDEARAMEIATQLEDANTARRQVERSITDEAIKIIEQEHDLDRDPIIVVAREGWHPGVVGIVASRLVDRFWRPAIVIGVEGAKAKGSGRSIPGFHIQSALVECAATMTTFGGHAAAAGMSLDADAVPALRERLIEVARERLTEDHLERRIELDAILALGDVGIHAVEELAQMEPFGEGNPAPRFGFRGLSVSGEPRLMGKELQHLSAVLTDGRHSTRVVAWNDAERAVGLRTPGAEVEIAGRVAINEYRDRRNVQVTVSDWIIHADAPSVDVGVYPRRDTPSDVRILDSRQRGDKGAYLGRVLGSGERAVVYVRDDVGLSQARKLLGDLGHSSGVRYLDASASADDLRDALTDLADEGARAVITPRVMGAAPSDHERPCVGHVVFCHPPTNDATFVECCEPLLQTGGPSGQADAEPRYVHLLFNERDVDVDRARAVAERPTVEGLRHLYTVLRDCEAGLDAAAWREQAGEELSSFVDIAVAVFLELELLDEAEGVYRARSGGRRRLEDSDTYRAAQVTATAKEMQSELWRTRAAHDFWDLIVRYRRGLEPDADGVVETVSDEL